MDTVNEHYTCVRAHMVVVWAYFPGERSDLEVDGYVRRQAGSDLLRTSM